MLSIIKASAGSGKTYTLTLEYISLLLTDNSKRDNGDGECGGKSRLYRGSANGYYRPREYHRHILAVTFTNKATEEMKQRIVLELSILAGIGPKKKTSKYLEDLCEHFEASEEDIKNATKNVLTELLFDYTNFNISTIDSFFQIILRTFAAEVNIPYDYDIELNEDYVLQVGIHNFLTSISANQKEHTQALSWLNKYVNEQLRKGNEWNPFILGTRSSERQSQDNLFSLASFINKETYRNVHSEMDQYLTDSPSANINSGSSKIGRFQDIINKKIDSSTDKLKDAIKVAKKAIESYDTKKRGCFASWLCKYDPSAGTFSADMLKDLLKYNGSISDSLKKGINPSPQDVNDFNDSYNNALAALYELLIYTSINKNLYQLGLLGYIAKNVTKFRQDNNMIQLSDTNQLLADIITDDDAPFIYERIGTRINNFLIDEFQDTSAMQWSNMKPLLSQSLSMGYDNLIIGDEKQCIYRFRNSDPSLLQNEVEETFKGSIKPTNPMSRNWRSTPNVIKFNNALFDHITKKIKCLSKTYSNVVQLTNSNERNGKKRNINGFIRIEMRSKDEMKNVAASIPKLIYSILDRGYKQSDIAILVDRNSEGATIIEQLLEHNKTKADSNLEDLNVVSSDSLLLANSPSVRLIVSHLRYLGISESLTGTSDEIKTKKALNEKLHRTLRQYERNINLGKTPAEALDICFTKPDYAEASLKDIRSFIPQNTESYSLVSVVERIINAVLSKEALHDENPFIQAFQDLVIDFSSRYNASILSFLRWWDRSGSKLSISSPAGANAINVMTIHKSKGLEFPCVIIPFATWKIGKKDSLLWIPKKKMEESGLFSSEDAQFIPPITPVSSSSLLKATALKSEYDKTLQESITDCMNKTYVAFTRAEDELYIFTEEVKTDSSTSDEKPLGYYINDYITNCKCQDINAEYAQKTGDPDADIAAKVSEKTEKDENENSGIKVYELGSCGINDREEKTADKNDKSMNDYKVTERPELEKFKTPEIYINEQREEGTMLHKVLNYIHTMRDVERTLFYCKTRYIIPEDKYDDVRRKLNDFLNQSNEVKSWFADNNRVYNERPIIIGDARPRPDRIIVTPSGETIVIDFKFGEQHSDGYKKQVHEYMHLLEEAGFKNITGKIWYVNDAKIVDVPL